MEEIIGIILNNWTGLKMAIEHGMGGNNQLVAEKVSCMINMVMETLSLAKFSWETISDNLEEIMDAEFNTILEDGSTDEIAQCICELFGFWKDGDLNEVQAKMSQIPEKTTIQQLYQILPPAQNQFAVDTDTVEEGNSFTTPNCTEDGWTEVKRKR